MSTDPYVCSTCGFKHPVISLAKTCTHRSKR